MLYILHQNSIHSVFCISEYKSCSLGVSHYHDNVGNLPFLYVSIFAAHKRSFERFRIVLLVDYYSPRLVYTNIQTNHDFNSWKTFLLLVFTPI